ncbi:MAG: toxin-antitoxin system HicB family antitoxin [Rubrivivax sp.]|nr:toxin-antitoxin system HicB family antitoxin [Rubrivivax sp.]
MSTLTIRLPDDKHERLKALAENRHISVNKLIDELATIAIANHDARLRFVARSVRGDVNKALTVLERLGDL